jgi:hypothetical protein
MTSPIQVLFFLAVSLSPAGTHHVTVSGGDEVYSWDKGDALDDAETWVYDRATSDRQDALATNDIIPANFTSAQRQTMKALHGHDKDGFVLYFDSGHELQKTSQGYVYVVRPGAVNEKFYSFTFK